MMNRKPIDGLVFLEFESLRKRPEIKHAVCTRHGGVSTGPYESLNLDTYMGDHPANVAENLERVRKALGLKRIVMSHNCHGKNVEWVHADSPTEIEGCDGLITQEKGIGILVRQGDCQAALFYDPKKQVIAVIHAGWRGNVQNIYGEAIRKLKNEAGCDPQDLLVCISPSLGPEAAEFKNYKTEFPESFWKFQVKPNYFNLWEIARHQLIEAGIRPEHIEIAGICTNTTPEDFFSYRREKVSGRNGTLIALV
jgi:YfiH family protein